MAGLHTVTIERGISAATGQVRGTGAESAGTVPCAVPFTKGCVTITIDVAEIRQFINA